MQEAPNLSVDVLCNLSYMYIAHRKVKRALDYLDIASALEPENIQIKKLKAMAFYDAKEYAHALLALDDVDSSKPEEKDRLTSMLIRSYCLNAIGETQTARSLFETYIGERKKLAFREYHNSEGDDMHETQFEFSERIRNMKGDKR